MPEVPPRPLRIPHLGQEGGADVEACSVLADSHLLAVWTRIGFRHRNRASVELGTFFAVQTISHDLIEPTEPLSRSHCAP